MTQVYISTAVIFALSLIFLLGVQFFIHRPLRQISEAAKQYAIGNLDYEIPVHTHDELGYLSASLNYMAVRLKDMDDYQKKIVANVSHDFRSPLTSIKGYVEAMADGTIPPELYGKYLNIILFEDVYKRQFPLRSQYALSTVLHLYNHCPEMTKVPLFFRCHGTLPLSTEDLCLKFHMIRQNIRTSEVRSTYRCV